MILSSTNRSLGFIDAGPVRPVTVVGNEYIRSTFCDRTLQQARNCANAPGVSRVVLNPDAHLGYGAPVGSVLVSEDMVYPGPVGVDIKCSMSLLQTDIPGDQLRSKPIRRILMKHIANRIPTGAGYSKPILSPEIGMELAHAVLVHGADDWICEQLGIPEGWTQRCEDWHHGNPEELEYHCDPFSIPNFEKKAEQLGSLGGGNHFLEAEITKVVGPYQTSNLFGLRDGCLSFLTHCGSRGIGHALASRQFKKLQDKFDKWHIPYPGDDRELVYAPADSDEGRDYVNDMSMGANFATVNHLLLNKLIQDAVHEVFPNAVCNLVYFVSHNIMRKEIVDNRPQHVHRKGATRAFPAGHHELRGTPFQEAGHPILLPGNPVDGSAVMVALPGAELSCYSINHGAGRVLGRRQAKRELDQLDANELFADSDILYNGRDYPIDESPKVYKDFSQVLASVEEAGLAAKVANLDALFVIKDGGRADD